jgi:hypothetical protein
MHRFEFEMNVFRGGWKKELKTFMVPIKIFIHLQMVVTIVTVTSLKPGINLVFLFLGAE